MVPNGESFLLAAVGVVHVKVLEHKADLGAVEYDLVVAVEHAASKVAAIVALVAHKARTQRGGELVLGCDETNVAGALMHVEKRRPVAVTCEHGRLEWADQIHAGQLPSTWRCARAVTHGCVAY
eukprot:998621-Pleurochrysis_carterae.AAC.1